MPRYQSQRNYFTCIQGDIADNVTEQMGGWTIYYYRKDHTFLSGVPSHLLGSPCPLPEERRLSMPEIGEKERNYLFKSYTDLRVMT